MEEKQFSEWMEKLGNAWCARDPYAAASLFAKDVKYYESVFDEPCASWDDVLKLWLVVPESQKDITFEFKIISIKENTGIANFKVSMTVLPSNQPLLIDGIFMVSLNKDNLCTFFKQWTLEK